MNKMASCLFILYFSCIIFLAVPTLSNEENVQNHKLCSTNYSCGKIQIGYPFWGENRPKFCGIPELKISCNESKDGQSTMNIFGNAVEFDVKVSVLRFEASSNTVVVSVEKLLNVCHVAHTKGVNIISSLRPEPKDGYEHENLTYGCTNCNYSNHNRVYSFKCFNYDGSPGSAFYFGNTSVTGKSCSCQNNVAFLFDKRGLNELGRSTNETFMHVLKQYTTLTLKYKGNFTACSKCKQSGGSCGSLPDNLTSEKFLCYCRSGSYALMCPPSAAGRTKLILGLGIGVAALGLVALVVFYLRKKLKLSQSELVARSDRFDFGESELETRNMFFSVPLFTYKELAEATGNFDQSNELGNGGFGVVYYGKLKDGREIAVKCLHEKSYRRVEQFMNEIRILTHLRHHNLVSLYGCTSYHFKELILVYEFVKNGTVADHLYGKKFQRGSLPWPVRLKIAIETATALSYLHASEIIHRDVKTNNILLDSNFGVKVADFGLSRLFPTDVTHVSTAPQGTPGYLDPEYHLCYKLTDKSDVYSFGVVLIELISSLPAINMNRQKLEINLSNYAINKIQKCAFDELVDPQLGFAMDSKVRRTTTLVAELAFQCLQHDKEFRPSMDEVLETLKSIESTDYEALSQVNEIEKNVAAVEDSEPLHAEDEAKKDGVNAVKKHYSNTTPSTVEEDVHAQLLSSPRLYSSSPISVTHKWVSRSTTPSTSNSK